MVSSIAECLNRNVPFEDIEEVFRH
jgi:hypothetical protein